MGVQVAWSAATCVWFVPGQGQPCRLQSVGSFRVSAHKGMQTTMAASVSISAITCQTDML